MNDTRSFIRHSGTQRELGGKAWALSQLESRDLPIPAWFVVTPEAFTRSVPQRLKHWIEAGEVEAIEAGMASLRVEYGVAREIRAAVANLCAAEGGSQTRFAVRSSAVDEDGSAASFAGQLESFLYIDAEAVTRHVAEVWRSAFSPRILAYRREHRLRPAPPTGPAVLVQRMVNSDCAGVAFSADPVSGRRGLAVVAAVYGLGTALVGGDSDADVYEINREGVIERSRIAHKGTRHGEPVVSNGTVAELPVAEALSREPVLSPQQAAEVAAMARQAAAFLGRPQDIEWAMAEGRLHLLQSRPITTLAQMDDPEGARQIWDNSNIIESYSGVTTALTFSFARSVYEGVYRQFCIILRVPKAKIAAHRNTYSAMLGLIEGRVYYNLLNWYRVLALLPGFTANRRFMEQMMGVREPLPDEIAAELAAATRRERLLDALNLIRMAAALLWNGLRLEARIGRFQKRLDEALAEPATRLSDMRLDELAAHYRELEEKLLTHWDAPLLNDFFAMLFHGLLRKLASQWISEGGAWANEAMRGGGELVSAEPAARLHEMAEIAGVDAKFTRSLCEAPPAEALAAARGNARFNAVYERYLAKFGDRCFQELKLESESLRDNPLPLLRHAGAWARSLQQAPETNQAGGAKPVAVPAAQDFRRPPVASPWRRWVLAWVLRQARARVRQREALRLERTRLFGRVRHIFQECGRRLWAEGKLAEPEEVFHLQVEEILGAINGTGVNRDFLMLAALRRGDYERHMAVAPLPDRFESRGVCRPPARPKVPAAAIEGSEERSGIGCCAGVVRGVVQVVRDPRTAPLPAGRILVAEQTDPGWMILLFPSASGLLVERGSLLSHSAIVARELGIPAVVSIPGLTSWLRDGDVVELDGATGTVRQIATQEVAHA